MKALRRIVAAVAGLALLAVLAWYVRRELTSHHLGLADTLGRSDAVTRIYAPAAAGIPIVLLLWIWAVHPGRRRRASSPAQIRAAQDRLAAGTSALWDAEAVRRHLVHPGPARVSWRWEDSGRVVDQGWTDQLHDHVYALLPPSRLAIAGPPGSGKSGALLLLLQAALDHRERVAVEQRHDVPVPVWLSAGEWDATHQSLRAFAVATLHRDHPYLRAPAYGPDVATTLVNEGAVALFLDGLEQLPEAARTTAIDRLTSENDLRVVVTSRVADCRQPAESFGFTAAREPEAPLAHAVVQLLAVQPEDVGEYLTRDQTSDPIGWQLLAAGLKERPASATAVALNNPLALDLARAAYSQGQSPGELSHEFRFPDADAIRTHLLDKLIDTAYPNPADRARALRWLGRIAVEMGPDRHLPWWFLARWSGSWLPRVVTALPVMAAFGTGFGLAFGMPGAVGGVALGLFGGMTMGWGSGIRQEPAPLVPRRPRLRDVPALAASMLMTALVVGVALGLMGGVAGAVAFGPAAALAIGLATGLLSGFVAAGTFPWISRWEIPDNRAPAATPLSTYRADLRYGLAFAAATGLTAGTAAAVVTGLTVALDRGPGPGLVAAAVAGVVLALVAAVTAGMAYAEAPVLLVMSLVRALRGRGPIRLLAFLEDARDRGILRAAGPTYEFRHAELQDRFVELFPGR